MKWLDHVQQNLKVIPSRVLSRFPLTLLLLFMLILLCFLSIQLNYSEKYAAKIMTLSLGVIFSHAFHLFEEQKYAPPIANYLIGSAIAILLGITYWYLDNCFYENRDGICLAMTYFGSVLLGVLLISFIPHLKNSDNRTFLAYNRAVFTHFFVGVFYTGVLFLGLTLALIAIDNLFSTKINSRIYSHLAVFSFLLVFGLHFLTGFPDKKGYIESRPSKIFSIFSQYLLIPIVLVYGTILLVYSLKSALSPQNNPEWTQWLILWFYIGGFLAYLLNLSITYFEDFRWAKRFCRWFYYYLLPLSLFTIISIFRSIKQDGLTELKYILMTASVLYIFLGFYELFVKNPKRLFIPIVVTSLLIVTIYGPQAACPASIRSQKKQLKSILIENGIIKAGSFVKGGKITQDVGYKIIRIISFFNDRKALQNLKSWDSENLLPDTLTAHNLRELIGFPGILQEKEIVFYGEYLYPAINLSKYELFLPIIPPYRQKGVGQECLQLEANKYLVHYREQKVIDTFDLFTTIDAEIIARDHFMSVKSRNAFLDLYIQSIELEKSTGGYFVYKITGFGFLQKK